MNSKLQNTGKRTVDILYIDDQEADAVFFEETLKASKIGVNFYHVASAQTANDYLAKRGDYSQVPTPDIIFLDVNLPKKNGYEILKDIRNNPAIRHIPVLMFSGSSLDKDILASYTHLANAHIRKPLTFDEMMGFIRAFEAFWINCALLPEKTLVKS